MEKKFYVTTAIDYVNSKPHIGHAFEKVLADAIIRWNKINRKDTWFLTGTDENAQKNEQAAKKEGISTKKFVDRNSKFFLELCKKLDVDYDRFIRTTESEHKKISQEIFKKVYDKGEIYKGKYKGYYCIGCESFKTERELVDKKCTEHPNIEIQWISEDAYFFKLSKYKDKILKLSEKYIIPEKRKNEITSRLKKEGLKDLCVSRTNLDWGIDNPIDQKFKIYVWFDALINYISGANGNWPADVHVIGKGINWFHSVIWPAILISAGYSLPSKLLVHGYLNIKGKKISKSVGEVIDPIELVEKYGSDSVRYSLLKCSVFEDSDYSEELLIKRHNNELADKLGNLISRVSALAEKYGVEPFKNKIPVDGKWKKGFKIKTYEGRSELQNVNDFYYLNKQSSRSDESLLPTYPRQFLELLEPSIKEHLDNYEFDKALGSIFSIIDFCNWYVQERKIWENKNKERTKRDLYELVEAIRKINPYLGIFIPKTSEKIGKTFKTDKIKKSGILFEKIKQ